MMYIGIRFNLGKNDLFLSSTEDEKYNRKCINENSAEKIIDIPDDYEIDYKRTKKYKIFDISERDLEKLGYSYSIIK